ncbi:MAG TPA: glycosyltransferase family 4 protein [Opitutaceae bacterium]
MSKRGVVLAHPSGHRFFRELAAALQRAGVLSELCTAIDWRGGGVAGRLLPERMRAELERRSFSRELGVPVATHPWREAGRLAAARLGWRGLVRHETGLFSVDAVYREFDAWVARRLPRKESAGVAYAYEDAAEATLTTAGRLGWRRAYDLPIAYWETSRRLLEQEAERWPAWDPTLVGTRDSAEKCARKTRELAQADLVVCPSRFVADSIPAAAGRRVVIAPFGSPPPGPPRERRDPRRPLRVLFAGSMSQRKGLADLFAAMRLLKRKDIELVVFGSPVASPTFYRRELESFTHEAPRPHAQVLELMRTCDVLCLPSIVEGRALVVQEAMSMGLPAVITANTGADDVVREGESGFVVPVRAPAAIAEKLDWLADNRDAVAAHGEAARQAAARFTWADYGAKILSALAG